MGLPAKPYLQLGKGSRDVLFKYWDPLHISETSDLVRKLITRPQTKRMQN